MSKVTLSNILTGFLANLKINQNFATLTTAIENTLSRDGTGPNTMAAQLDMGSNRIINVGAPQSASDAIRLVDLSNYSNPAGITWLTLPGAPDPMLKSGGTMTGPLVLSGAPTAANGAATKNYVDLRSRVKLPGATTLYVRTTGSDSTGDGSLGNPFRTPQATITGVQNFYDLNGQVLTIDIGPGTFGGVNIGGSTPGASLGCGNIIFSGAGIGSTIITDTNYAFNVSGGGMCTVMNMSIGGTGKYGIFASNLGAICYGSVDFRACSERHAVGYLGGALFIAGNYSVSGAAKSHIQVASTGICSVFSSASVITLTGTPAFSIAFIEAEDCAHAILSSAFLSFSGSCTGARAYVGLNSTIDTLGSGATFFPGSSAVVQALGGQYA